MPKTLDQISPELGEDLELLFKSFEMEVIRAINDFERQSKTVICSDIQIIRYTLGNTSKKPVNSIKSINYSLKRHE